MAASRRARGQLPVQAGFVGLHAPAPEPESVHGVGSHASLAARMRPTTLEEVVG
jgi:hypothetical protein